MSNELETPEPVENETASSKPIYVWGRKAILLILFLIGLGYTACVLDESVTGHEWRAECPLIMDDTETSCNNQLHDSVGYMMIAKTLASEDASTALAMIAVNSANGQDGISTGVMDNFILYLQGFVAYKLFPVAPQVFVYLLNFLILVRVSKDIEKIAEQMQVTLPWWGSILLLANPLLLMSCVSLTKEIWGLFLICEMVRATQRRSLKALLLACLLGALTRFVFCAFGILLLVVVWPKRVWIRKLAFFFIVVLLWCSTIASSLSNVNSIRESRSSDTGQSSAAIMQLVVQVQAVPFGDLVTFPIMFLANALSPVTAPIRLGISTLGTYWYAVIGSSVCFGLALLAGVCRVRQFWKSSNHEMQALLLAFLCYAIVVCHFPFLQHRYLLPIWPLLALLVFGVSAGAEATAQEEAPLPDGETDVYEKEV